jgi:glycosyltransferase involved in cell wall biosynthesis
MGLKVLLLTRYGRTGASSRLRFLQYLPGLVAEGVEAHVAPFLDDTYLKELYGGHRPSLQRVLTFYSARLNELARAREFDVVWIEKEALPWMPAFVELLALRSASLVVDFDDAWHLRYAESHNPVVRFALAGKLGRMAQRSDTVIVANRFLQSWAEGAGASHVSCIPTVVDLTRYAATPLPPPCPFTIGWIGTPETVHYLDTIQGALRQVLDRGDTRLLLIGPGSLHSNLSNLPNVETRAWSEGSEITLLQRIHVGIMPLPHGLWEYGKSAYKLVQYMAAARPVVASPVGANVDLVKEGVNGLFARTEGDWVASLERLRDDPEFAAAMGASARTTVERSFSLTATLPKIIELLHSAARSHRT